MKKSLLIIVAAVVCSSFLSSCKKSWTCTCVDTSVNGGNSGVVIYPNETKAQAETNCLGNEQYTSGGSSTIKCTLN